jgi:hypothetical protein
MSRAVNLTMALDAVVKHCHDKSIDISVVEPLPDGGVRLVCSSSYGAELIRRTLRSHLIAGDPRRERFRPRSPLW